MANLPAPFCAADLADGRLERLLPPHRSPAKWVYAAFPSRELPGAARAFVEFIASRFDTSGFLLPE